MQDVHSAEVAHQLVDHKLGRCRWWLRVAQVNAALTISLEDSQRCRPDQERVAEYKQYGHFKNCSSFIPVQDVPTLNPVATAL